MVLNINEPVYDLTTKKFSLELDNPQFLVQYSLYKDNKLIKTQYRDSNGLIFKDLSEAGVYSVKASYCDITKDMNNSVNVDFSTKNVNSIIEKSFNSTNSFTTVATYFDGLNRPIQKKIINAINGKDIIQSIIYDDKGRNSKALLSYNAPTTNGYVIDAIEKQNEYYTQKFGANHYAFSESKYSNTPDDKIIEQSSPGYELRMGGGHTVKTTTVKSSGIKKYILEGTSVTLSGTYSYNDELILKQTTDAENVVFKEYYDSQGNLLCKSQGEVETYYIYDDLNRQRYIISPNL